MIVRGATRSCHRAGCPQLGDRGLVVTSLTKDLIAVLADAGWTARLAFLAAVDPDRAVDGEHGIVLERHEHFVVDHLLIVRDVVEDTDYAEHQAIAVEDIAPFGEVPGGKDLVEDID